MFAVHKTLVQPSAVAHAIVCRFTSILHEELVLVKGSSCIEVWRMHNGDNATTASENRSFVLQAHWKFYGKIIGIDAVTFAKQSGRYKARDILVVVFEVAKVAVVEYSPQTHSLHTISLHSFEDGLGGQNFSSIGDPEKKNQINVEDGLPGFLGPGTSLTPHKPLLSAEPNGRCAAIMVHPNLLAVIPFHQSDALLDEHIKGHTFVSDDEFMDCSTQQLVAPSYVLSLHDLNPSTVPGIDASIRVRDLVFVHGYLEPTMAIVYEHGSPTWAGMAEIRKDTVKCSFVPFTISAPAKDKFANKEIEIQTLSSVLFTSTNLPFSTSKLIPVPSPLHGVLMMASEGLIYLSQATSPNGVGVCTNAYCQGGSRASTAVASSSYPFQHNLSHLGLHFDGATASFYEPRSCSRGTLRCLFALPSGELWSCDLYCDSVGRSVESFKFSLIGKTPICSALLSLHSDPGCVFLASGNGSSLLMKELRIRDSQLISNSIIDISPSKRAKIINYPEDNNKATVLLNSGDSCGDWVVLDELPSFGNLKDSIICQANVSSDMLSILNFCEYVPTHSPP
jgi:cleavage and polyadenylation specificity factor subunit 1